MNLNKKNTLRLAIKTIITTFLIGILLVLSLFLSVYWGAFGYLPDELALSDIRNEQASLVYSIDGVIIGKFFAENRTNIKQSDIPEHLKNALIATEDKRFFSHSGYDTRSYFRVFLRSILMGDKSGGGGSTLTQQLVKNLFGRDTHGLLTMPVNKLKEAIVASRMEDIYNKDELLLLYLNSVPFGEDVYGIESASRRFFNKPAKNLKIQESAVLVGMLKANTYFNPHLNPENSKQRRNTVLRLMKESGYLTQIELDSLQKTPLGLDYENLNISAPAGYFVYQVRKQAEEIIGQFNKENNTEYDIKKDGLKIYTTLNMQVQKLGHEAINDHLQKMQKRLDKELKQHQFKKKWLKKHKLTEDIQKRNIEIFDWQGMRTIKGSKLDSLWHYYKMLNASLLITNPQNGAVICWIGGNSYNKLPFDMILSHRQIASAFKPVLYATAIESGIEPCQYLENKEKVYEGFENWKPQNANKETTPDSTVAMWYALTKSMNIPSVELYFQLARDSLYNTCKRLKFSSLPDSLPSVALGALDLSLYEIVKAYGAFANKGELNELVMIEKICDAQGNVLYKNKKTEPTKIFNTETSEQITAILEQVIEQGTATKIRKQYKIKAELAGKTGTAQNYSNAWFISYTPKMVIGTWVGASTPEVHFYSSKGAGSSLALPIAAMVLARIEKNEQLKNNYLAPFNINDEYYSFLDCAPYRQVGIKGFLNRLFSKKEKNKDDISETGSQKRKKRKRKPLFKRRKKN